MAQLDLNKEDVINYFSDGDVQRTIVKSYLHDHHGKKFETVLEQEEHFKQELLRKNPEAATIIDDENIISAFYSLINKQKGDLRESTERDLHSLTTRLSFWSNTLKEKDLPKNPEDLLKKYATEHATADEKALLENDEYKTQVESIFQQHHTSLKEKFGQ